MPVIYVSTGDNKLAAVEVDSDGNLIKILQNVEPVVDPMPPTLPENAKGPMGSPPAVTEWLSRHPSYSLLYALTSFWNEAEAIVTTYRIDEESGTLTKLGSTSTGGYQAAHAVFSPDGSTYAIAHHNGGALSLFDATKPDQLEKPLMVVYPPEIVPGTKKAPEAGKLDQGLPALHGVNYAPNGRYLICADPVQNAVFTYAVDAKGRLTSDEPTSQVVCKTSKWAYAWIQRLLAWALKMKSPRPRRAVVHPNGKYLYIIHEWTNFVQIYAIDDEGNMDPKLLGEVSCVDPSLCKGFVGIGMTAVAELEAYSDYLIVSARGMAALGGRSESSVRLLAYKNGGSDLESVGTLEGIPAAVRHFYRKDDVIWVGINSSKKTLVVKYGKQDDGKWVREGEADVGLDVFCVVPKDV
jgi:6-phosphogluconolactonase (cycloisomerase 2 family)